MFDYYTTGRDPIGCGIEFLWVMFNTKFVYGSAFPEMKKTWFLYILDGLICEYFYEWLMVTSKFKHPNKNIQHNSSLQTRARGSPMTLCIAGLCVVVKARSDQNNLPVTLPTFWVRFLRAIIILLKKKITDSYFFC